MSSRFNIDRLYASRNLPFISRLSNLLTYNCSQTFLMIHCISVVSAVISPLWKATICYVFILCCNKCTEPFMKFSCKKKSYITSLMRSNHLLIRNTEHRTYINIMGIWVITQKMGNSMMTNDLFPLHEKNYKGKS